MPADARAVGVSSPSRAGPLQPAQSPGGPQPPSRSMRSGAAPPVRGGTQPSIESRCWGHAGPSGVDTSLVPSSSPPALPGRKPPHPRSSLPSPRQAAPGERRSCPRPGCDLQPRESPEEGGEAGGVCVRGEWGRTDINRLPQGQRQRSCWAQPEAAAHAFPSRGLASSR